jgi:hypothetical protein
MRVSAHVTSKSFAAVFIFMCRRISAAKAPFCGGAGGRVRAITISVLRLIIAETERPSRTLRAPTCAYITSLLPTAPSEPEPANRIAPVSPAAAAGNRERKSPHAVTRKSLRFFSIIFFLPDNTRKVCDVSCGRTKFAYIENFAAGSKGHIPRHFPTIAPGDISLFAPAAAATAEHKLFAIRRRAAPGRKGFCQISLGKEVSRRPNFLSARLKQ